MVNFECVVILPRCKIPHVLKECKKFLLIKFNNVYNHVPFLFGEAEGPVAPRATPV